MHFLSINSRPTLIQTRYHFKKNGGHSIIRARKNIVEKMISQCTATPVEEPISLA